MTSGSSSSSFDQTNLQFSEVHIYDFPFKDVITTLIGGGDCPSTPSAGFVKYLSEIDSFEWRVGILEAMHPKSMASAASGAICSILSKFNSDLCIGSWGPMYPRRGFFVHSSPVVSSAALVWRGVNIATLTGAMAHIVTAPLPLGQSFSDDKLQLIYPVSSSCIKPGQNPATWDYGKTSGDGKYLWVYWIKEYAALLIIMVWSILSINCSLARAEKVKFFEDKVDFFPKKEEAKKRIPKRRFVRSAIKIILRTLRIYRLKHKLK